MRWTLVALVISCAHDETPAPVAHPAPSSTSDPVVVDASPEIAEPIEAALADVYVRDAAAEREAWHAVVDALVFSNVEHETLGALVASSGVQAPVVHLADVRSTDGLDVAVARRIVLRNVMRARYCYERALQTSPDLDKLSVTIRVAAVAAGNVVYSGVAKTNAPRDFADCVALSYAAIDMPQLSRLIAFEATLRFDQPPPAPHVHGMGAH